MNKKLLTLTISNGLTLFASGLLIPYFVVQIINITNNSNLAPIPNAVTYLGLILSNVYIYTKRSDRAIDERKLLLVGWLSNAIVTLLLLLVLNNLPIYVFLLFLSGLSLGLTNACFNTLFTKYLDKNIHDKEFSMLNIVSYLLLFLASILSPFLYSMFGLVGIIVLAGVFQLGSVLLSFKLK